MPERDFTGSVKGRTFWVKEIMAPALRQQADFLDSARNPPSVK